MKEVPRFKEVQLLIFSFIVEYFWIPLEIY